jgi:hypothetical protein
MHVDDGPAGCTSLVFLGFIKGEIKKAFGIKDLGPIQNFLGVQFECNLETCELWLHQEMFIDSLQQIITIPWPISRIPFSSWSACFFSCRSAHDQTYHLRCFFYLSTVLLLNLATLLLQKGASDT